MEVFAINFGGCLPDKIEHYFIALCSKLSIMLEMNTKFEFGG